MNELLQEDFEMHVYDHVSSAKSPKWYETGVHGGTSARDSCVGGALLEVDDHLMEDLDSHTTTARNDCE